jgi:aryl-alcohol dehydrogenase-like predicted oxidoreductase/histidinol phosphatase-like enzyme/predicted kinase
VVTTAPESPLAIGCMRLSTAADRDAERALATLHAALEGGVTFLDTADAYARDDGEAGHNERLVARALASFPGDTSAIRVATKGGLTRPGGAWVADGRARHLALACERSLRALGRERLDLYQLHAPDPRTPLATSVRALASLRKAGLVAEIGLSNVTVGQIDEARRIVDIAAVQVEMSPWQDASLVNGVAEHCVASGIRLLAYRPLGGPEGVRRILSDPVLRELAQAKEATPVEIVLAWLRSLSALVVPLPGPTRADHAREVARSGAVRLDHGELARLDERFPSGRVLRVPRSRRRPSGDADGDVVLVMGLPGAGKSTIAAGLVAHGYLRLNRDESGGSLKSLLPALERAVAAGRRRIVLDNTYISRRSRGAVVERAWSLGLPVRCVWLRTSLADAQVNAAGRIVERYGRLLAPEELRKAARNDPAAFAPSVQFRYERELEAPHPSEGFTRIETLAFERRPPEGTERGLVLWYDGVLRRSRSGRRTPAAPDDVEVLPGRADVLRRYRDEGYRLLGLSWHPEIAAGATTEAEVAACFERTHAALGVAIEVLYCSHPAGPPLCWCRKPLPGLGAVFIARHRLDPRRSLYVGHDPTDRTLATRLGFAYRDASEVFEG